MKPGRKNRAIPFEDLPNSARKFRLDRNLSLIDLAKRMGVSCNSLSEYELRGSGLGKMAQWKLAIELDVDFRDLIEPGQRFADQIRQSLRSYQPAAV